MTEVTPLRREALTPLDADGYGEGDIIIGGDGVWYRRGETSDYWDSFGADYATHHANIPQPWALIVRAGETISLARARHALMVIEAENAQLRKALAGDGPDLWGRVELLRDALKDARPYVLGDAAVGRVDAMLAATDPARGGQ